MARLNWNDRRNPTDFDNTAPEAPSLEFDYRHAGGAEPWPLKHCGMKFGPSLIKRALASGLLVYAEVENVPYPVMVKEANWDEANVLHVTTLEGPRIPQRLFTRPDARGLTSSGLLTEETGD